MIYVNAFFATLFENRLYTAYFTAILAAALTLFVLCMLDNVRPHSSILRAHFVRPIGVALGLGALSFALVLAYGVPSFLTQF